MMFACTLLQDTWMKRMIAMAKRVEKEVPDFRKRMMALRNESQENALMLLLEAEQVRAEETAPDLEMIEMIEINPTRVQLLVKNKARPSDGRGGPSAKSYATDLGISSVWDHIAECKKTRRSRSKGGTLRKKSNGKE